MPNYINVNIHMAMDVLTWNVSEALSDPRRAIDAAAFIVDHDADVAVLTEAYYGDSGKVLTTVVEDEFRKCGYSFVALPYEPKVNADDKRGLMVLAKKELKPGHTFIDCAGRSALKLSLKVPTGDEVIDVSVFGAHLDEKSAEGLEQTEALLKLAVRGSRTVIAGEFKNANLYELAQFADATKSPQRLQHIMTRGLLRSTNFTSHALNSVSDFAAVQASVEVRK